MKKLYLIAAAALVAMTAQAKVTFAPHLTDHMVLQQNAEVILRGTATPGKTVTLTTSWDGKVSTASVAADGKWSVKVATPAYGGPYSITASDGKGKKNVSSLSDILIGEVWICTGQSNMEMAIASDIVDMDKIYEAAGNYPELRLLHVDNTISVTPEENAVIRHGEWKVSSAEAIRDFSAIGYLYGRELQETLGVPVGLIMDCWGGTLAEAWTSTEYLRQMPYFEKTLDYLATVPADKDENARAFEKAVLDWNEAMKPFDVLDPAKYYKASVPGFLQTQDIPSTMGYSHMIKKIEIPAAWAGKDLTLKVGAVDDNDCTFFNGTYVGHTEGCARHSVYTVPGALVAAGEATIDVRMMDTGGMGGILGGEDNIYVEGPDGSRISLMGEWDLYIGPTFDVAPLFPIDVVHDVNIPTGLYNAMLHPMTEFPIAGAIWYQGESNTALAEQYRELLPLMIANWRADWGYDFPFYICQIASYMAVQEGPEESAWAMLREAQAMTSENVENTALACLIDVGEANDIHPKNKIAPAHRLALCALAGTYGYDVEYSGPVYAGYKQVGSKMVLRFDHAESGLVAGSYVLRGAGIASDAVGAVVREDELKGFYISGPDHVFHAAKAEIVGNTIVVSSDEVSCPTSVRYGWANTPVCNLYNGEGLPCVPFRTDIW